mgnify:CR=1 FL=1
MLYPENRWYIYIVIICLASIFLLQPGVFAYRPFTTEDAAVGCRGDMYLETSWERMAEPSVTSDTFLLVYGYSPFDRLELSAEVPYVRSDPDSSSMSHGVGDLLFSGKFLFLGSMPEDGSKPKGFVASLKGAVKTRSGDEEKCLGSGENEEEVSVVISRCFGPLTAHLMAGYTLISHRNPGTESNYYLYGYAMDFALSEKIQLGCEITGQKDISCSQQRQEVDLLAGIMFSPAGSVVLDAYFRRSLVHGKDFNSFGIGSTFGF